jgi:integrase
MVTDMPKPRPPYLQRLTNRHGNPVWYVHKRPAPRVLIRAEYGSPGFEAEYNAALVGPPRATVGAKALGGTLGWLWDRYRESVSWAALSPSTRRQRENIMGRPLSASGSEPFASIKSSDLRAALDGMEDTPCQANHLLKTMRGLFKWATGRHLPVDPTLTVKPLQTARTEGFPVWTEDDVARYQAKWPVGTKERVWLDVLLYTGLRRGDAVTLGRQHVRNGTWTLRTEKSQGVVEVSNPMLPILSVTLAAGPTADLAFICGPNGKRMTKAYFGNEFRDACDAAGVRGKAAHGLRKAAATRCAENGATVPQLMALFGWRDPKIAMLYIEKADRKRMSAMAGGMMQKG